MQTLYWKNITTANEWENILNWFTDAAATIPALSVPWTQDDAYKGYDLTLATGETGAPNIGENIGNGFVITGTCDIAGINNNSGGYIIGGTFSGTGFNNSNGGYIIGGIFFGTGFTNGDGGYIIGGIFFGTGFTNTNGNGGYIIGGIFFGTGFNNSNGVIYGGIFFGTGFNNSNGVICGGIFSGTGFNNSNGAVYGWNNYGIGIYFMLSGNLQIQGLPMIKCKFNEPAGTIVPDPSNGIFFCNLSSDVLGSGLL